MPYFEPKKRDSDDDVYLDLIARACDDAVWLRAINKKIMIAFESARRAAGMVSPHVSPYASFTTCQWLKDRKKQQLDWLDSMAIESECGETLELKDVHDASVSNPANRRHELMTQLRGGQEYADSNEHGDYPVGTYKRNPVGTEHAPIVKDGCMIIVKLGQFQDGDDQNVEINTANQAFTQDENRAAVQYQALHKFKQEMVRLERWAHDSSITLENTGGIEVLVVNGEFGHQGDIYRKFDWLRLPVGTALEVTTTSDDCTVWIKTGHHSYRL